MAVGQRQLLMAAWVEDADDLAPGADRAGNPDAFTVGPRHPLGDARFAVARRAMQEKPLAGEDRPPKPLEGIFAQRQVRERPAQVLYRRLRVLQRLGRHAGRILLQADRRRAEITANVGELSGALRSRLGQFVDIIAQVGRRLEHHQAIGLERMEYPLADAERDADLPGDLAAGGILAMEQKLQRQRLDLRLGQAKLIELGGSDRHELGFRRLRLVRLPRRAPRRACFLLVARLVLVGVRL